MTAGDTQYRATQRAELLRFAAQSLHPDGFGYLDNEGHLEASRPIDLYLTCRMTHVFALGLLAGEPPAVGGPSLATLRGLAQHGVDRLLDGPLRDTDNGGWFAASGSSPASSTKEAYGHAHLILAASTACAAGLPRAPELLDRALTTHNERFWDEATGLVVEEWNADWSHLSPYRGMNSTMHTVECYLAAGDATSDHLWYRRAGRMADQLVSWAHQNSWRIPEHFTEDWQPVLEFSRDEPSHPFRPYGATIGHGLEWARLLIHVHVGLGAEAPDGLVSAAQALAGRAIADGWHADGTDGFIYTTDWAGKPVVRSRMHWVVCEAIATSHVLAMTTAEPRHLADLSRWWEYVDRYLVDHAAGSWHHELDPDNQPSAGTWSGKPDAYHIYQALKIQDLPLTPSFASSLVDVGRATSGSSGT